MKILVSLCIKSNTRLEPAQQCTIGHTIPFHNPHCPSTICTYVHMYVSRITCRQPLTHPKVEEATETDKDENEPNISQHNRGSKEGPVDLVEGAVRGQQDISQYCTHST